MTINAVYKSYAFEENWLAKQNANLTLYDALMKRHRVYRTDWGKAQCNHEDYDIIIEREAKYHHALYTIVKNSPALPHDELALLCDEGSLIFGYMMEGEKIHVFED